MNKNVARTFYDYRTKNREEIICCSCGYVGKFDYKNKECPKCGTSHIKCDNFYFSRWYNNSKHTFNIIETNVQQKSFYVKKINVKTNLCCDDKDSYKLNVLSEEIFETWFDVENPESMKIKKNNVDISTTKSNIQKALSHIDLNSSDFENTIFSAYKNDIVCGETLSNVIMDLRKYPQYEIFYNTYNNLKCLKNLNNSYLQQGKSPSKILHIPKTVWNTIYKLNEEDDFSGNIFKQWKDILPFIKNYKNKPDVVNKVLTIGVRIDKYKLQNIIELFVENNYDIDKLYTYLSEDIYTYQGIDDIKEGFQILYDYIHMSKLMNVSFEKYPKSLKLRHDLAEKNLNIIVTDKEKREMELVLSKDIYKDLEYKDDIYEVLRPTCAQDIIEEGKRLHHCVGSYVDLVRNNQTMILFMRDKNYPKESLITLEVRDGTLRQYAGSCDRKPTEKEMKFIEKYCKKKDLEISGSHMKYYR